LATKATNDFFVAFCCSNYEIERILENFLEGLQELRSGGAVNDAVIA
jgi:hypothetical protein